MGADRKGKCGSLKRYLSNPIKITGNSESSAKGESRALLAGLGTGNITSIAISGQGRGVSDRRAVGYLSTAGAAFWLWCRSAKESRIKDMIVVRVRARKKLQLLVSGWESLKMVAMVSDSAKSYDEFKDTLSVLNSFKYTCKSLAREI